jgi:hypothetical protein
MGMQLIETITVGSGGAASITFDSIPTSFTDLYLVTSFRSDSASIFDTVILSPNSSTANGQRVALLVGTQGGIQSVSSTQLRTGAAAGQNTTSNTFSNDSVYISNYAGTTAKSMAVDSLIENNAVDNSVINMMAQTWNDSSAITSLTMQTNSGNFVQYSSASLYGITAD